jgi:hypothetical protein
MIALNHQAAPHVLGRFGLEHVALTVHAAVLHTASILLIDTSKYWNIQ